MSGNGASGSFGTGPTSGYFLNFMFMFIIFVTSTLDHALSFIYKNVIIYAFIFGIKMNRNWPLIPTIQKLDRAFSVSGFAAHLKPNPFDGTNYKRWVRKLELWLISMSVWFITEGPTTGPHTLEEERTYQTADNLFRGAVISVLGDNLVDAYMHIPSGKELWDALEAKFGASDAGSELYVMEQFYDYRMVDDRSVVEQAHELQALAKELDNFKCNLPEKFVAGGIIAKLPPSWRNFATSLKHRDKSLL